LIEPLNVRELQILRLIEEGMVNKDVSATLAIGLDTVEMASQERVQEARRCGRVEDWRGGVQGGQSVSVPFG
jgi:FixJ family two-component response regulator